VVFAQHSAGLAYYINHNTVILQTAKKGETAHNCKVGVNELVPVHGMPRKKSFEAVILE
jgi:hypothetical protein